MLANLNRRLKLHSSRDAARRVRRFERKTQHIIARRVFSGISFLFANEPLSVRIQKAEILYDHGMKEFHNSQLREVQDIGKILFCYVESCNEHNYDNDYRFADNIREIIQFVEDNSDVELSEQLRRFSISKRVFTFADTKIEIRQPTNDRTFELIW